MAQTSYMPDGTQLLTAYANGDPAHKARLEQLGVPVERSAELARVHAEQQANSLPMSGLATFAKQTTRDAAGLASPALIGTAALAAAKTGGTMVAANGTVFSLGSVLTGSVGFAQFMSGLATFGLSIAGPVAIGVAGVALARRAFGEVSRRGKIRGANKALYRELEDEAAFIYQQEKKSRQWKMRDMRDRWQAQKLAREKEKALLAADKKRINLEAQKERGQLKFEQRKQDQAAGEARARLLVEEKLKLAELRENRALRSGELRTRVVEARAKEREAISQTQAAKEQARTTEAIEKNRAEEARKAQIAEAKQKTEDLALQLKDQQHQRKMEAIERAQARKDLWEANEHAKAMRRLDIEEFAARHSLNDPAQWANLQGHTPPPGPPDGPYADSGPHDPTLASVAGGGTKDAAAPGNEPPPVGIAAEDYR